MTDNPHEDSSEDKTGDSLKKRRKRRMNYIIVSVIAGIVMAVGIVWLIRQANKDSRELGFNVKTNLNKKRR